MRILLAGATGVIGRRVAPLLVAAGHHVVGTTRSGRRGEDLRTWGVEPAVVDVYDADALRAVALAAAPDLVMHQLTDLPDDAAAVRAGAAANARMRREGTRNLLAAAAAAGADRFVAQSVAWTIAGDGGAAVTEHERMVLDAGGVVIRYGQFYGSGTYHPAAPPPPPRIQIDAAARRTLEFLTAPSSIVVITDETDETDETDA